MSLKNRIINILLISLLVLGFSACSDSKEVTDKLIEKENKTKLTKPQWEDILANYKNTGMWYQQADDNEIAASNIAYIYGAKIKDTGKAIEWHLYSDSIKENNENLYNLAVTYKEIGDLNKAIIYYKKSFILNHPDSTTNLGMVYIKLKEYKKAEKWFKKGIERENLDSQKNLGLLYHNNLKDNIKASAYLINLIAYPNFRKDEVINLLKNKWKIPNETINKGYELQLKMEGLPRRYTGDLSID